MGKRARLHLVKLCVGVKSVQDLSTHQSRQCAKGLPVQHITRMWPRRADELLAGGSLYWVIQGVIQARQEITDLQEAIGADGIRRCAIRLSPRLFYTEPLARRAFQGWRYLEPTQAPSDLDISCREKKTLPLELERALSEIGVRAK